MPFSDAIGEWDSHFWYLDPRYITNNFFHKSPNSILNISAEKGQICQICQPSFEEPGFNKKRVTQNMTDV